MAQTSDPQLNVLDSNLFAVDVLGQGILYRHS